MKRGTRAEGADAPPLRAIIESTTPRRNPIHTRRPGLIAVSTLECGHITDTNAGERTRAARHGHPCWDCFYGKPADRMGAAIAGLT